MAPRRRKNNTGRLDVRAHDEATQEDDVDVARALDALAGDSPTRAWRRIRKELTSKTIERLRVIAPPNSRKLIEREEERRKVVALRKRHETRAPPKPRIRTREFAHLRSWWSTVVDGRGEHLIGFIAGAGANAATNVAQELASIHCSILDGRFLGIDRRPLRAPDGSTMPDDFVERITAVAHERLAGVTCAQGSTAPPDTRGRPTRAATVARRLPLSPRAVGRRWDEALAAALTSVAVVAASIVSGLSAAQINAIGAPLRAAEAKERAALVERVARLPEVKAWRAEHKIARKKARKRSS